MRWSREEVEELFSRAADARSKATETVLYVRAAQVERERPLLGPDSADYGTLDFIDRSALRRDACAAGGLVHWRQGHV